MVPVPGALPVEHRDTLTLVFGEVRQRGFGLPQGSSLVDRPEVLGHLLTVLPGDIGQTVTLYANNAGLLLALEYTFPTGWGSQEGGRSRR